MGSTNISFRTEEATRDELDEIAARADRDRSWVINQAIANYLELDRWQREKIEAGIAATNAGRTRSTEEVRDQLAKLHADTLAKKKPAKAK